MFESVGFEAVNVEATRKRTSKKELYEFVVSARRPLASAMPAQAIRIGSPSHRPADILFE